MINDMTDEEINELIAKKTGRYMESEVIQIPRNKFNIGDNIVLTFDKDGEEPGVVNGIIYSLVDKSWEYNIIIAGFVSIRCVTEKIIRKLN